MANTAAFHLNLSPTTFSWLHPRVTAPLAMNSSKYCGSSREPSTLSPLYQEVKNLSPMKDGSHEYFQSRQRSRSYKDPETKKNRENTDAD